MHFPFYPKHRFGCAAVDHCPHLGSASLGSVVNAANVNQDQIDLFWRQIDGLRAENTAKYRKIEELTARIEQLERELKAERQKQFKRKKRNRLPKPHRMRRHPKAGRNAARLWVIQAGIASGPAHSISWFSSRRHACARIAAPRSRRGPTASPTTTFRKIGLTASG